MTRNSSKKSFIWLALLIAGLAIAFAVYLIYQSSSDDTIQTSAEQQKPAQTSSSDSGTQTNTTSRGTTITTAASEFGPILFNGKKQAIYIWEVEKSSTAECYGDCAAAWPPVLTEGEPIASGDIEAKLLGTTKRTDGTTQVTYNNHPLYYYAHEGPGEVKCHNVSTHGGLWWVVQPNGNRVQ